MRKRFFSTNLSSPHGPKETELVVLVRPAPDSRKSPTAIGSGVPQEEESNSTTTLSERRATLEAQRPRCGVRDLWSAITDLRTHLSSLWRGRARDLIIHGSAHRGANGVAMPTDEDDQDGHFFYNHPERGAYSAA